MSIEELGLTIKARRIFLQLSQEDLAEMSGVAIKTLHLIEKGQGNPSFEILEKLAEVLGMELLLQVKKME